MKKSSFILKTMALIVSAVMVFNVTPFAAYAEMTTEISYELDDTALFATEDDTGANEPPQSEDEAEINEPNDIKNDYDYEYEQVITAFVALSDDVENQTVPYETPLSDVNLPAFLEAVVQIASSETDKMIPVSWVSTPDYNGTLPGEYIFSPVIIGDYTVIALPSVITVTVEEKPDVSGDIILIAAIDELDGEITWQEYDPGEILSQDELALPELLTGVDTAGNPIAIHDVAWESDPAFDGDATGFYEFKPVLPDTHKLTDDVEVPVIAVLIRQGLMAMTASAGIGVPDTNWYTSSGRDGSPGNEYLISNADELAGLSVIVNNTVTSTAPFDDFAGKIIILTDDIDLSAYGESYNWTLGNHSGIGFPPIGGAVSGSGGASSTSAFRGTFDGNNKTISGLYINVSRHNFGLFGSINNAIIKNIHLEKPIIDKQGVSNVGTVGTLVGEAIGGSQVIECSATDVDIKTINTISVVGGLVGHLSTASIIDSYTTGKIDLQQGSTVGGLVGNVSPFSTNTGSKIERCFSAVDIITNEQSLNIGGIIGSAARIVINNCYATGDIIGGEYVGGIAGTTSFNASISNSYATGSITGNKRVGGIVGSHQNINNNVALNPEIIAGDNLAGRISGSTTSPTTGLTQNRALETMVVEQGGMLLNIDNAQKIHSGIHGTDAKDFNLATFWTNSFDSGGMGWDSSIWIFEDDKYPKLRNAFLKDDETSERGIVSLYFNAYTIEKTFTAFGRAFWGNDNSNNPVQVSIYCNDVPIGSTTTVNRSYSYDITFNDGFGEYEIKAVITSVDGKEYSVKRKITYGEEIGLKSFNAFPQSANPVNLLFSGLDIIWYMPNTSISFEVTFNAPSHKTISEAYIITTTGRRITLTPIGGKWVSGNDNLIPNDYISGRLSVFVVWEAMNTVSGGFDQSIQTILGFVPDRYDNSILMPNNQPGITTKAYVAAPNASPNSGSHVINPNDGWVTLAADELSARATNGSKQWEIKAEPEAVGKTYVFWAHGGPYKEYVFLTINAPGYYTIGTQQNGMNHLSFYGIVEESVTESHGTGSGIAGEGRYRLAIDPSGHVYEAVPSNRLEGVTATIYENGSVWDASEYEQQNPLITDSVGYYGWDVPPGSWQVKYHKAGYEPVSSISMPVAPEHTEVHIGMVSKAVPTVEWANGYPNGIELMFNKYMDDLNLDTIKISQNGIPVPGSFLLINRESNYLPLDYLNGVIQADGFPGAVANAREFASVVRFVPTETLSGTLQLTVSGNVKSYAGIAMGTDYSADINIVPEPESMQVNNLRFPFNETDNIIVQVYPAAAAAGKTIKAVSDNPHVVAVQNSAVVNGSGQAIIEVTGFMPGAATITLSLDGTLMTAQSAVEVTLPLSRRDLLYTREVIEELGFTYESDETAPVITSANKHETTHTVADTFQVEASGTPNPTFNITGAPAGVAINPSTGLIRIAGAVEADTYQFSVTAENSLSADTQDFTLTVNKGDWDNDNNNNDNGGNNGNGGNNSNGDSDNNGDGNGGNNGNGNDNNNSGNKVANSGDYEYNGYGNTFANMVSGTTNPIMLIGGTPKVEISDSVIRSVIETEVVLNRRGHLNASISESMAAAALRSIRDTIRKLDKNEREQIEETTVVIKLIPSGNVSETNIKLTRHALTRLKNANAGLVIETPMFMYELDADEVQALLKNLKGDSITISAAPAATVSSFRLRIKESSGKILPTGNIGMFTTK